jgi:transcriptional regulator with XRE-family HTH domain
MPKISECLAANLVRLRKEKGLSQEDLAEKVGISRGTIAKYEAGSAGATLSTIVRLSKALGCEETDLVSDPTLVAALGMFAAWFKSALGSPNTLNLAAPETREMLKAGLAKFLSTGPKVHQKK